MKFPLKRWPKLAWAWVHTRNPLAHRLVAMFPRLRLDRPVFVVGLPRSGTSIFCRLFGSSRYLAHWSEAPVVWDPRWRDRECDHRWDASRAAPGVIRRIDNNFAYYTKWRGCGRFCNKHPRNSLRIPFLAAGWPRAYFVIVERDPRAVAYSLISRTRAEPWRARFPLGQFARPEDWREIEAIDDEVERFCLMVASIHRTLDADVAACVDQDHLLTVPYEEFAKDCRSMLDHAYRWADIPVDEQAIARAPERLENRNFKWSRSMSPGEIRTMHRVLSPLVTQMGYEPDASWLDRTLEQTSLPQSD